MHPALKPLIETLMVVGWVYYFILRRRALPPAPPLERLLGALLLALGCGGGAAACLAQLGPDWGTLGWLCLALALAAAGLHLGAYVLFGMLAHIQDSVERWRQRDED